MKKQAGIIEPPHKMLDTLYQWTAKYFAGIILYNYQEKLKTATENEIPSIREVIQEALRFTNEKINTNFNEGKRGTSLRWELDDWKYADDNKKKRFNDWVNGGLLNNYVKVVFMTKDINARGIYQDELNVIVLFFTIPELSGAASFHWHLLQCYNTAKHELIHASQFLLSRLLGFEPTGSNIMVGLPGKKNKEYDPLGRPFGENKERLKHELHDLEFYTNLTSSLDDYRQAIIFEPTTELKKELAKMWVGAPNKYLKMKEERKKDHPGERNPIVMRAMPPFKTLIYLDDDKYKKAVKLFMIEVDKMIS